jgi:transposase
MNQICKHCDSSETVKNGFQKGHQNYFCKSCKRNFVPQRDDKGKRVQILLAIILYGSGGVSYNYLSKLFGVCTATVCNWVNKYADDLADPVVNSNISEIEIDEMWHFINEKKTKNGSLKPLIALAERQLHGLRVAETPKQ